MSLIVMEIVANGGIIRLPFADLESAQKQFDALSPKIGNGDAYGLNKRDEDERRHIIESAAGKTVVAVDQVRAATVLDYEAHVILMAPAQRVIDDQTIDREIKMRRALRAADDADRPKTPEPPTVTKTIV